MRGTGNWPTYISKNVNFNSAGRATQPHAFAQNLAF
jgi:hypothetical protein